MLRLKNNYSRYDIVKNENINNDNAFKIVQTTTKKLTKKRKRKSLQELKLLINSKIISTRNLYINHILIL